MELGRKICEGGNSGEEPVSRAQDISLNRHSGSKDSSKGTGSKINPVGERRPCSSHQQEGCARGGWGGGSGLSWWWERGESAQRGATELHELQKKLETGEVKKETTHLVWGIRSKKIREGEQKVLFVVGAGAAGKTFFK